MDKLAHLLILVSSWLSLGPTTKEVVLKVLEVINSLGLCTKEPSRSSGAANGL